MGSKGRRCLLVSCFPVFLTLDFCLCNLNEVLDNINFNVISPIPASKLHRKSEVASGLRHQWRSDVDDWFIILNEDFITIKELEAKAAWVASTKINHVNQERLQWIQRIKESWRNGWCATASEMSSLPLFSTEEKQLWLLCRGPRYSPPLARAVESIQQELYRIYHTTMVCLKGNNISLPCVRGEPTFARLMERERDPETLLVVWEGWHNSVGSPGGKRLYQDMVRIMNEAARSNGYVNVADCWKEHLGISDVESVINDLMTEVMPLYELLHAYVRHRLGQFYGRDVILHGDQLPAHLLGNMWAQSWVALWDIICPFGDDCSITTHLNMTVLEMAKSAEDFYASLGLEKMTPEFWASSQFVRPKDQIEPTSCHPSALDMYSKNDFRIQLCGEETEDTFVTLHHEMGHIQYYMHYAHQPGLFRDGANPSFHEAVGDSMIYSIRSPAHRSKGPTSVEERQVLPLLLQQALHRLPLITWSLVVDLWRWRVFEGRVNASLYNEEWWTLRRSIQGVRQPRRLDDRTERFDPLAKFHIPDNSPYMPYFFSSFLEVQFFKGLCQKQHGDDVDMMQCDLYGATKAGAALKKMMSLGQSRSWKEALKIITGNEVISAKPLLSYYGPLMKWLQMQVEEKNIPVGW